MSTGFAVATLAQLVTERPSRARVFEQFGLDYCCGGHQTLEQACAGKGLDLEKVGAALATADASPAQPTLDWSAAPLGALVDHILEAHHAYLKSELPRLGALAEKVAGVHGEHHPELFRVRETLQAFTDEMYAHLSKEENVLFPMLRRLEAGGVDSHCGSVRNPIRVMLMEHDNAGAQLEEMRRLTGGFTVPADGCRSYKALLEGLQQLEYDTHQHVHKENNLLFPRAVELED